MCTVNKLKLVRKTVLKFKQSTKKDVFKILITSNIQFKYTNMYSKYTKIESVVTTNFQ